jgi:hypothetical protein
MFSAYQLSSAYPAYGYQEGVPLAIYSPHLRALLHCPARSLFRAVDSPGSTGGDLGVSQLLLATSCRKARRRRTCAKSHHRIMRNSSCESVHKLSLMYYATFQRDTLFTTLPSVCGVKSIIFSS